MTERDGALLEGPSVDTSPLTLRLTMSPPGIPTVDS